MNGFLTKDFKLFLHQGHYYGMVLILACVLAFTGTKNFSSFVTSYLTFMITMFSFSSFSYDEYDNGMEFLMALPRGRQDYVKAKYVFSILLIFGGWLLGSLIRFGLFVFRFSMEEYLEILPEEPVYLMICLIFISCAFPILIRYGAEKGRNMSFIILAVTAFGVFFMVRLGVRIPGLSGEIEAPAPALIFLAAICFLVLVISFRISMHIMKRKEF